MRKVVLTVVAMLFGWSSVASAGSISFFGEDLNGVETARLVSTPNSDAARDQFFSQLIAPNTADLENLDLTPNDLTELPPPFSIPFGPETALASGYTPGIPTGFFLRNIPTGTDGGGGAAGGRYNGGVSGGGLRGDGAEHPGKHEDCGGGQQAQAGQPALLNKPQRCQHRHHTRTENRRTDLDDGQIHQHDDDDDPAMPSPRTAPQANQQQSHARQHAQMHSRNRQQVRHPESTKGGCSRIPVVVPFPHQQGPEE